MFRHKGKTRTHKHNLRIASLLSFVAGIVNVAGFLAVLRLTTNVTGHFAYLIDEVFRLEWWQGMIYFLYILSFFLGSFTSNFLVEWLLRNNKTSSFTIPILLESMILFVNAFAGNFIISQSADLFSCCLLFAMGLQNSLVTTISNATVRTTHLTGLFTDLGIELSQLFFYSRNEQRGKLTASINLRLSIICFFFLGGILSGILYSHIGIYVLAVAGFTLLIAVYYDTLKLRSIMYSRKRRKNTNRIIMTSAVISILLIACSSKVEKTEKTVIFPGKLKPVYCDVNGDGINEKIAIVENIVNRKSGLQIEYSNGHVDYLGMGKKVIGQNFDNFDWIGVLEKAEKGSTFWSVVNEQGEIIADSNEVAPNDRIKLKNDGILVHASESCGGGVIYLDKKIYKWIQQE